MKIKKLYFFILAILFLSGCSDDLMNPVPLIEIDPGFADTGFVDVDLISQNESEIYSIVYSRVYGISRELTMKLNVDQSALDQYNSDNGTAYQLLPSDYYSFPETTVFELKSNNADFDITFSSKELYEFAGSIEKASEYVLPIKAVPTQDEGVDAEESENTILIHVNMLASTISVSSESSITNLYFSKDSEISEVIEIEGTMNFSGIDASAISVVIDDNAQLLIDSTDYKLLPANNYSFSDASVDESGGLIIQGQVNAKGLSENTYYVLPCILSSSNSNYVINQTDPVYYVVTVTDLQISITGASSAKAVQDYTSLSTLNNNINITTNIVVPNDLTINFEYAPDLISDFNSTNGQSYQTPPEGSVSVSSGTITKGTKSADIPYSVNLSELTLDDGVHYLVPLRIKTDELEFGSVVDSEVIYLDVTRTLIGEYNLNVIDNERTRSIGNTIWDASECQRASETGWDAVIAKAQYGFGGDGDWYAVLFSITDEDMTGKENCKKIEIYTFLELLEADGGTNKVTNNNSYFNTATGEIYIDCSVYESYFDATYKETYSFTLK